MTLRNLSLYILAMLCSYSLSAQVDVNIVLTEFATGLDKPVDIADAGDDRLFVVEKEGTVRIVAADGSVNATPFLDIEDETSTGGLNDEKGLLGIAFHPNYADNGFFYVNYTRVNGDTRISRFTVSADPDVADLTSKEDIITIDQPYGNHNGGCLRFGPDGYLYIGMGDGGSGEDPQNYGQSMDELLGKMLRIDVDGMLPYEVPASNPFVGTSNDTLPEIWASGIRNPWKFSFDSETGDLWIADVGQYAWEEVDFQAANSTGGENYGWRCYEGNHDGFGSGCPPMSEFEPAIAEYNHSGGHCSISGGAVYRGTEHPNLHGKFIYVDYCSGQFWSTEQDDAGDFFTFTVSGTQGLGYTAVVSASDGSMYAVQQSQGKIYEISDNCSGLTTSFTVDGNTLSASTAGSYQWFLDGEAITGADEQDFTITESGNYSVEIVNADGCTLLSDEQSVSVSALEDLENVFGVSLQQNPVNARLDIQFDQATKEPLDLRVYDLIGKVVYASSVSAGQTVWSEDLTALAAGRYTLGLSNEEERSALPFLIAR